MESMKVWTSRDLIDTLRDAIKYTGVLSSLKVQSHLPFAW